MNKLQTKEVWVEVFYKINSTENALCGWDEETGRWLQKSDIEKQSGYFFTKEELEFIANKIFEAGRDSVLFEYNSPNQKIFIDNLLNP